MNLRAATPGDLEGMRVIEASSRGDDAWSRAMIAADLDTPGVVALVAEEGGRVLGHVLVGVAGGEAEVRTIAVSPDHRRRGLGRALLQAGHAAACAAGADVVFLEVAEGNDPAFRLYETEGYRVVGRRPRYYAGCTDALVMRRQVPSL